MRVKKERIVKGVADYMLNDVIPTMTDDKAMQIILDVAVHSIEANPKLADMVFESNTVKTFFKYNDDGTYEIEETFNRFADAIKRYGYFPVVIPPIKWISPNEKTFSFTESDIAEIKKRIERSAD